MVCHSIYGSCTFRSLFLLHLSFLVVFVAILFKRIFFYKALMPKKYACCKHGPQHLQRMSRCGFAHTLSEVELPDRIHHRMWTDVTHEPQG